MAGINPAMTVERFVRSIHIVMAGLVPAIHVLLRKDWVPRHTQVGFGRLAQLKLPISGKPEIGGARQLLLSSPAQAGDPVFLFCKKESLDADHSGI
jgi:hypothetical protein